MSIQIAAHGFELTQALKEVCESEIKDKLYPIALSQVSTKWTLSIEREQQIAHLIWTDGAFNGNVTVKTLDMYNSIHQCTKKALEQMKKSHAKKQNHHKSNRKTYTVSVND
jgi:ribosome-associated translation inhibitor RaiA